MRASSFAATLLMASLAAAVLLVPSVAAQASVEPDPEPLADAARAVGADSGAYAVETQARVDGQEVAWQGYAASAFDARGGVPVPSDETSATVEAAGEQGVSTVEFGSRSGSTVADGAAASSSNMVDSASTPAPTFPATGGKDPEPDPGPPGGGDQGPPPADGSGSGDAASAAESDEGEPTTASDATLELGPATVPLPSTAEAPSPTTGGLDPVQPAPTATAPDDDGPGRVVDDGAPLAPRLAFAGAPPAGALVSAIVEVSMAGLAAVAAGSVWLACRKPLA